MKLWDIARTVGSAALQVALPGTGSLIVAAINKALPADKQLPADATGTDVSNAVASLPPEQQAALMEKQFDVDITQIKESHSTLRAMLDSDAKSPHTTRPYIAKQAFHVVAFISVVIVLMWAYAVATSDEALVKVIVDGWPWVLGVILPFVGWLNSYFGTLKQEHRSRLDAANGVSTPQGVAGILSSLMKRR
jgi:hypothetical protein